MVQSRACARYNNDADICLMHHNLLEYASSLVYDFDSEETEMTTMEMINKCFTDQGIKNESPKGFGLSVYTTKRIDVKLLTILKTVPGIQILNYDHKIETGTADLAAYWAHFKIGKQYFSLSYCGRCEYAKGKHVYGIYTCTK